MRKAVNSTFLFERPFLDYHAERFADHSLLVHRNEKLLAVVPGHIADEIFHSHLGLTYGGIVTRIGARLPEVLGIVSAVLKYLSESGFGTMRLKSLPGFYNRSFAGDFHYAMFLAGAKVYRKEAWSVIDLRNGYQPSKARLQGIVRGRKLQLEVREVQDFASFWNELLIPRLQQRHGASPVHSLAEIELLASRFRLQIRQFNVYDKSKRLLAGTTIFETPLVAHAQYIAGADGQNQTGALDYLFDTLIGQVFRDKPFFDFGTSSENEGRQLNQGLLFWKESFGAGTVCQDFYEVDTSRYSLIDAVLP